MTRNNKYSGSFHSDKCTQLTNRSSAGIKIVVVGGRSSQWFTLRFSDCEAVGVGVVLR